MGGLYCVPLVTVLGAAIAAYRWRIRREAQAQRLARASMQAAEEDEPARADALWEDAVEASRPFPVLWSLYASAVAYRIARRDVERGLAVLLDIERRGWLRDPRFEPSLLALIAVCRAFLGQSEEAERLRSIAFSAPLVPPFPPPPPVCNALVLGLAGRWTEVLSVIPTDPPRAEDDSLFPVLRGLAQERTGVSLESVRAGLAGAEKLPAAYAPDLLRRWPELDEFVRRHDFLAPERAKVA